MNIIVKWKWTFNQCEHAISHKQKHKHKLLQVGFGTVADDDTQVEYYFLNFKKNRRSVGKGPWNYFIQYSFACIKLISNWALKSKSSWNSTFQVSITEAYKIHTKLFYKYFSISCKDKIFEKPALQYSILYFYILSFKPKFCSLHITIPVR